MLKHTHTPGPWRYDRSNGTPTTGRHMIAGAKPGYLAEVRDCGSGDVQANASLIAAAPALLDALQTLMAMDVKGHQLQYRLQFSTAGREILNKAISAIQQDTGESP